MAYRFSVDANITVRKATQTDSAKIFEIIQDLPNESDLILQLKKCHITPTEQPPSNTMTSVDMKNAPPCMVASTFGQIVGVLLMDRCDTDPFVEQYDVENFVSVEMHNFQDAPTLLRSFILNPLFVPHSKSIVGEACRLLGSTAVFYPMEASTRHDIATRHLILKDFVPVQRRRRIDYPNGLND